MRRKDIVNEIAVVASLKLLLLYISRAMSEEIFAIETNKAF